MQFINFPIYSSISFIYFVYYIEKKCSISLAVSMNALQPTLEVRSIPLTNFPFCLSTAFFSLIFQGWLQAKKKPHLSHSDTPQVNSPVYINSYFSFNIQHVPGTMPNTSIFFPHSLENNLTS